VRIRLETCSLPQNWGFRPGVPGGHVHILSRTLLHLDPWILKTMRCRSNYEILTIPPPCSSMCALGVSCVLGSQRRLGEQQPSPKPEWSSLCAWEKRPAWRVSTARQGASQRGRNRQAQFSDKELSFSLASRLLKPLICVFTGS
jgi:hypothetical protein